MDEKPKRLAEMTGPELDALVTMAVFKGVLGAVFLLGVIAAIAGFLMR